MLAYSGHRIQDIGHSAKESNYIYIYIYIYIDIYIYIYTVLIYWI